MNFSQGLGKALPPIGGRTLDNTKQDDFYKPDPIERTRTQYVGGYDQQPDIADEDLLIAKGDAKPEVHFIGQILGGANFNCEDGLFCEMLLQTGEQWDMKNPPKLYQTQTCYADIDEIFVWSHPMDLHFYAGDLSGWPKAIFIVWRLDSSNKMDVFSYGVLNLPRTKGFHRIECDTWTPLGDKNSDRLSFFMGTFPRLKGRDIIAQSLEKREFLNSTSSGKVIVELEVVMRNFPILGVSN